MGRDRANAAHGAGRAARQQTTPRLEIPEGESNAAVERKDATGQVRQSESATEIESQTAVSKKMSEAGCNSRIFGTRRCANYENRYGAGDHYSCGGC